MKRNSILLVLAVLGGLALESVVALSQPVTVAIKREAMSPGRLKTYPAGTFPVSTGLRIIPKGMKAYLSAQTTGTITGYNWAIITKPAGSNAAIDTATNAFVRFSPDVVGQYIVQVTVDSGRTAFDTLYSSTYVGLPATGGCICHAGMSPTLIPNFRKTPHATIFTRGITGQLEVEEYMGNQVGVYSASCQKCHTTGWDQKADNGNYGFEAKKTGFDSLWYKVGQLVNGEYLLPYADSTSYNLLQTAPFATAAVVGQIGCEQCHGPAQGHASTGDKSLIGKTFEGGICIQCHDAPGKHRIGSYWLASNHATMATSAGEASNKSCWPCHSGSKLPAYLANRTAPDYTKTPSTASISCVTCHDPHEDALPSQLRTTTVDKMNNGYLVPAGLGGKGQLCMNCHRARTDVTTVMAGQLQKLADRFYPHNSPQGDMFLGQNGAEYGLPINGLGSHQHLENGCVTCHMQTITNGSSIQSNHQMSMKDAAGNDLVGVCKGCHGDGVTSFDDVRAFYDYDGNGKIEGVQTEIQGLLDRLKAILPNSPSTGDVTNMLKTDSAIVKGDKNWPNNLPAIWNYWLVKKDLSMGVHNTKYTVAILRASLGTLTGIETANQEVPNSFSLSQNYPNPFNPTTSVQFSVPRSGNVTLYVYNSTGELVAKLADGMVAPGNYTVTWNGLDLQGVAASSGIYFYKLTMTDNGNRLFSSTKKMMLVK